VNLPRAQAGVSTPSGVVVTATADHKLAVNGRTVTLDGLEAELRSVLQATREQSVILQGDRSVVLEDAVQIMTIAKTAGAARIAIATEPEARAVGGGR
jgi:biopolymer transport protein ExbD